MDPASTKGKLLHTINNPLAGLLAELQLLEMDELTADQRAAVERSIALCRRVIQIAREELSEP